MMNGSYYYANGFNAYWLMFVASSPSQRERVSSAFQEAASNGLTVARTWGFGDGGYLPLQFSPGVYNEQMFQVYCSVFTSFPLFIFLDFDPYIICGGVLVFPFYLIY